jgi:hypothetical protein
MSWVFKGKNGPQKALHGIQHLSGTYDLSLLIEFHLNCAVDYKTFCQDDAEAYRLLWVVTLTPINDVMRFLNVSTLLIVAATSKQHHWSCRSNFLFRFHAARW